MVDRIILQQCTYPRNGTLSPNLPSSMYYLTWLVIVTSPITRNFWHTKMVNRVIWFALTSILYNRSQVLNTWANLFLYDRSSCSLQRWSRVKEGKSSCTGFTHSLLAVTFWECITHTTVPGLGNATLRLSVWNQSDGIMSDPCALSLWFSRCFQ